jgi:DJ-1/PfpI family
MRFTVMVKATAHAEEIFSRCFDPGSASRAHQPRIPDPHSDIGCRLGDGAYITSHAIPDLCNHNRMREVHDQNKETLQWPANVQRLPPSWLTRFRRRSTSFPRSPSTRLGYQVEVVSSRKEPVEIYSYFARTGLLDVDCAIAEARPGDYVGILVPGGAKSPALPAEDPRVTKFVQTSAHRAASSPVSAEDRCWRPARTLSKAGA